MLMKSTRNWRGTYLWLMESHHWPQLHQSRPATGAEFQLEPPGTRASSSSSRWYTTGNHFHSLGYAWGPTLQTPVVALKGAGDNKMPPSSGSPSTRCAGPLGTSSRVVSRFDPTTDPGGSGAGTRGGSEEHAQLAGAAFALRLVDNEAAPHSARCSGVVHGHRSRSTKTHGARGSAHTYPRQWPRCTR